MNNIDISCYDVEEPDWLGRLEDYCRRVLEHLNLDGWELSLVLTDDRRMADLNREYRGKEGPTDVLTFRLADGEDLPGFPGEDGPSAMESAGDIVISLDTLKRNATSFGVSEDEEFRRLIVHGILHLAGWDHATNHPDEEMLVHQEGILRVIGEQIL